MNIILTYKRLVKAINIASCLYPFVWIAGYFVFSFFINRIASSLPEPVTTDQISLLLPDNLDPLGILLISSLFLTTLPLFIIYLIFSAFQYKHKVKNIGQYITIFIVGYVLMFLLISYDPYNFIEIVID